MFDGLGFTEQIPPSLHDEVRIGSAITLGIRSEHLEVQEHRGGSVCRRPPSCCPTSSSARTSGQCRR